MKCSANERERERERQREVEREGDSASVLARCSLIGPKAGAAVGFCPESDQPL